MSAGVTIDNIKTAPAKLKASKYNISVLEKPNNYLLVNTRTTAALKIHDSNLMPVYHALLDTEARFNMNLDNECIEFLLSNGFIVPEDFDEIKWLEDIHWKARNGSKALGIGVIVTLACNFRCTYCYQRHPNIHLTRQMEEAIFRYVLNNLDGRSLLKISWFGGEPLLRLKTIQRLGSALLELSSKRKIVCEGDITTNGLLLTRNISNILKQVGISDVQITLDGPPSAHNRRRLLADGSPTFHRILENLSEIAPMFSKVILRINIDKRNQNEISRLLEEFLYPLRHNIVLAFRDTQPPDWEKNKVSWCISPDKYWGLNRRFNRLADKLGFRTIGGYTIPGTSFCAGYQLNSLDIDPYGDVYRCVKCIGKRNLRYGSLNANGRILVREGLQKQWDSWSPFLDDDCRTCQALPLCMGGCLLFLDEGKRKENSLRCLLKHDLIRGILRDIELNEWLDLGHYTDNTIHK